MTQIPSSRKYKTVCKWLQCWFAGNPKCGIWLFSMASHWTGWVVCLFTQSSVVNDSQMLLIEVYFWVLSLMSCIRRRECNVPTKQGPQHPRSTFSPLLPKMHHYQSLPGTKLRENWLGENTICSRCWLADMFDVMVPHTHPTSDVTVPHTQPKQFCNFKKCKGLFFKNIF